MKKLYIILALIMSSFFFYSSNVYAAYYNTKLSDEELTLINETFFERKSLIEKFSKDNGYNYYYFGSNEDGSEYFIFFYKELPTTISNIGYDSIYIGLTKASFDYYILKDNMFTYNSSGNSTNRLLYRESSKLWIHYNNYLYSNFSINFSASMDKGYMYSEDDELLFNYTSDTVLPSLLDLYVISGGVIPDTNSGFEGKETLDNFYTISIEKISLLATYFIENKIYLCILTILVLIFVIELIRRYLL